MLILRNKFRPTGRQRIKEYRFTRHSHDALIISATEDAWQDERASLSFSLHFKQRAHVLHDVLVPLEALFSTLTL